jgi:hypothetical protein
MALDLQQLEASHLDVPIIEQFRSILADLLPKRVNLLILRKSISPQFFCVAADCTALGTIGIFRRKTAPDPLLRWLSPPKFPALSGVSAAAKTAEERTTICCQMAAIRGS